MDDTSGHDHTGAVGQGTGNQGGYQGVEDQYTQWLNTLLGNQSGETVGQGTGNQGGYQGVEDQYTQWLNTLFGNQSGETVGQGTGNQGGYQGVEDQYTQWLNTLFGNQSGETVGTQGGHQPPPPAPDPPEPPGVTELPPPAPDPPEPPGVTDEQILALMYTHTRRQAASHLGLSLEGFEAARNKSQNTKVIGKWPAVRSKMEVQEFEEVELEFRLSPQMLLYLPAQTLANGHFFLYNLKKPWRMDKLYDALETKWNLNRQMIRIHYDYNGEVATLPPAQQAGPEDELVGAIKV